MNILMIGLGYLPYIAVGDKNFWFRLIPLLAGERCKVIVASINDHKEKILHQQTTKASIPIYNICRPFHRNPSRFYGKEGSLRYYRHKHRPLQDIIEIYLTVLANLSLLRKLVNSHNIEVIHFIDNLGPAMRLIKGIFPNLYFTLSTATYNPRGKLYDRYLKYSFAKLDKIIPYSEAYREKLIELGFPKEKTRVIKWSVHLPKKQLNLTQKAEFKRRIGIEPSSKLFLWSGFITSIQIADFWIALRIAQRITKLYDSCHFIFAFKPPAFRQEYTAHKSDRINIITKVQNFPELLEVADIFFSPVGNLNSIISPPLTWIEAMSYGTPIMTNHIKGVDEIVIDKQTGFVAETIDDLKSTIMRAVNDDNLSRISENARRWITQNYNIEAAAEEYLALWGWRRNKNG